jgi:hypothetical protein
MYSKQDLRPSSISRLPQILRVASRKNSFSSTMAINRDRRVEAECVVAIHNIEDVY